VLGANSIKALESGSQNAAFFDGEASRIRVDQDNKEFDFGTADFTVEGWVCTTQGGELISSSLTKDSTHAFRINLTDHGQIQFAVMNKGMKNKFAARSAPTSALDGNWHHIAVVRHQESVDIFVDGVSHKVYSSRAGDAPLNIDGNSKLTIGAFILDENSQPQFYYRGLMREIRVWGVGLDAAKIQSRMKRKLNPTIPHLLGYWPLDGRDLTKIKNAVPGHPRLADVKGLKAIASELHMDSSEFPYLLEQARLQWPYSGHWSARGDNEVSTAGALSNGAIISFGTDNALYGVHSSDGSRAWSKDMGKGCSAPVAAMNIFYVLSGKEGLMAIAPLSGSSTSIKQFERLIKDSKADTRLSAPAVDAQYMAAASPDGDVWIIIASEIQNSAATPWKEKIDKNPGDLTIADGRVYCVAGKKLYQFNPAEKKVKSIKVVNDAFLVIKDSVFCVQEKGKITELSASNFKPVSPAGGIGFTDYEITGIAASYEDDRLIATTAAGKVYGLTMNLAYCWAADMPVPKENSSAKTRLNAPVISGREVFCTSQSGAVAAFDVRTGATRGQFFEPAAIITPPIVNAGTVYFGCAAGSSNLLDGAFHSVVFGQTYALRLGVDGHGVREANRAYGKISGGNLLPFMSVDECCVEAWINTTSGGEIVSLCAGEKSRYGLRLWLDSNGALNFVCTDQPKSAQGQWKQLSSKGVTTACDGKWHHIAVSRVSKEKAEMYFDGQAMAVTSSYTNVTPTGFCEELKVLIGANGTAAEASNFFAGMIGEVRIWDTYLESARITERMHNKLLGSEPDLIACWDFEPVMDTLSIYDRSREKHNGVLHQSGGNSGFWLTDLNFTHPAYPYIETSSRQISNDGIVANFEMTVTAKKANGEPLPNHPISLWYVKREGESGPEHIDATVFASQTSSATLQPVSPHHSDDNSINTQTDKNGNIVFNLRYAFFERGPSLDLRAGFMPKNERYHISDLTDSSRFAKPTPPRLEAQSTLIQDYDWSPGDNKIDHTRDKSTWRTVIKAMSADGKPRPGERFQLWANQYIEIEVGGRTYPINPQNSASFNADSKGELTVAIEAADLKAPTLSVWAGFMNRNERYNLPVGQEVNNKLANMKSEDLTKPRMSNWENTETQKKESMLDNKDYHSAADDVAGAIRQVMSATQPESNAPMRARRRVSLRNKRTLRSTQPDFRDMEQPEAPARANILQPLQTLQHIQRETPVNLDGFRNSLVGITGSAKSIGFTLKASESGDAIEIKPVNSIKEARLKMPPPQKKLLGNIFDDIADFFVETARAVERTVKEITIFIANQINVIVEFANGVVTEVVKGVEQAIAAVVYVFEMIKLAIERVIAFLRMLFDWGAILRAKNILKGLVRNQLRIVKNTLANENKIRKDLSAVFTGLGLGDLSKDSRLAGNAGDARQKSADPKIEGEANSVHSKFITSKANDNSGSADTQQLTPIPPSQDGKPGDTDNLATTIMKPLSDLTSNPFNASFADLYKMASNILSMDLEALCKQFVDAMVGGLSKVGDVIKAIEGVCETKINIPFVSDLYEWITGNPLTILDFTCLAIAVPVHIGYGVMALIMYGEIRTFADDFEKQPKLFSDKSLVASKGKPRALGRRPRENLALHWAFFATNQMYIFFTGATRMQTVTRGGADPPPIVRVDFVAIMGALYGITCTTLFYYTSRDEDNWDTFEEIWQAALYAVLIILELKNIYSAIPASEPSAPFVSKETEEKIKVLVSVAGVGLLVWKIAMRIANQLNISDLFFARDILKALSVALTLADTTIAIKAISPQGAGGLIIFDTFHLKTGANALHIAGVLAS
jgi:hypothetical protein